MRSTWIALFVLGSGIAAAAQKPCTEGHRERVGTLGIGHYFCRGGSCAVNGELQDGSGDFAHYFSIEPVVGEVEPGRELRDGDVLLSIDGVPVTTREAGRRLANLEPGVAVALRIRRDGLERDVIAVPRLGCEEPSLTVGERDMLPPRPTVDSGPQASRPEFGMRLDCDGCGWSTEDGRTVWHWATVPRVVATTPGGPADIAGVRVGDRLLSIDGHWTFDEDGGAAIGAIRPGQRVKVRVARGEETIELWLVAE